MTPSFNYAPDGMSAGYAPASQAASSAETERFEDAMVVNRIGDDGFDDGLVHAHEWAAAQ